MQPTLAILTAQNAKLAIGTAPPEMLILIGDKRQDPERLIHSGSR